jgi:hypothetical protein
MSTHPGYIAGQAAFDLTPDDWKDAAWLALEDVVWRGQPFTTDDLLPALAGHDVELRALGALMRQAQKRGWITPGGYVASTRRESHMRPKRQWLPCPDALYQ